MNCYSAHLSIDVQSSLKQKKYIYFIQLDLIVSIFLFILSNLIIHSLSFLLSLSLSFISHSSQAPLSQHRHHRQAHSCTIQLASFFFHFIKSGLIHSLSFTVISHPKPLKLTLSTSPIGPLSTSSAQSHSLNSDH